MRTSHRVQMPQKSTPESAGVHADTVWSKGRYKMLLPLSFNMHIDIRAHRLGFLRSGFNERAGADVLEGSKPNVDFSASCECLLTLTLNPLEQSLVPPHQLKVKANPTRGWAPELHVPGQHSFSNLLPVHWHMSSEEKIWPVPYRITVSVFPTLLTFSLVSAETFLGADFSKGCSFKLGRKSLH